MKCLLYDNCHKNLGITEEKLPCLNRDFTQCYFFMSNWLDKTYGHYVKVHHSKGITNGGVEIRLNWNYRGLCGMKAEPWLWYRPVIKRYNDYISWLKGTRTEVIKI